MRWRGALAACAAALGLVVVAPTVAFAQSQLLVGAGTADITPPAFDLAHDEPEFAANCPNLSSYTGKRFFKFEEPYIDQNGNDRYDYPEPFCDANHSGGYDGIYLSGAADSIANSVRDHIDARAIAFSYAGQTYEVISIVTQGTFENYIADIRDAIMKQRPVADVIVSSDHNTISGDWPGEFERRLEAKGGMGMAVFLVGDNGSEEDPHLATGKNDCSGLTDCETFITTVGQAIADYVGSQVPQLTTLRAGRLAFDRATLYVPIENNAFKAAAGAQLFGERHTYTPTGQDTQYAGPDVRTHVSALRVGPDLQVIDN